MKKYVLIFAGILMLTVQCKKEEEVYSFKEGELSLGGIELIDSYLKYSDLPKALNVISMHSQDYENRTIYSIDAARLLNTSVSSYQKENFSAINYKGFIVFISPELKGKVYNEKGILEIEKSRVEVIDEENHIPYPDDIISSWEFEIMNGIVSNFAYQFCDLTKSQIKEIESIKF